MRAPQLEEQQEAKVSEGTEQWLDIDRWFEWISCYTTDRTLAEYERVVSAFSLPMSKEESDELMRIHERMVEVMLKEFVNKAVKTGRTQCGIANLRCGNRAPVLFIVAHPDGDVTRAVFVRPNLKLGAGRAVAPSNLIN